MTMIFLRSKASAVSAFTPADLFASSEEGAWYEPSPTTCFTDTAGTTAASVGDAVARINDLSGNGNHATQGTAAARPILRQTAGGLYYLDFDGIDDTLVATLAMSTLNMTAIIAVSITYSTGDRYWSLRRNLNADGLVNFFSAVTLGSVQNGYRFPQNLPPPDAIAVDNDVPFISTYKKDGTALQSHRVNQGTETVNTNTVTTFTSELLELSSQSGTSFGDNRLFGFILTNDVLSAAEISSTETYLAAKSGVTL